MIAYLDRALIARAELVDRLKAVERLGFPYARYKAELAARGLGRTPPNGAAGSGSTPRS